MKGKFISFEGPDGAGKTTQVKVVQNYLQNKGYEVVVSREPGGTLISEKIRELLLDPHNSEMKDRTEALLYAAARAQHVEEKIKPALMREAIVLCDRFSDSTIAYQGYGRKIDLKFLDYVNELAVNSLKPDLTLIFDLDPKIGLERIIEHRGSNKDRLEALALDFHQRVRDGFLNIAQMEPDRCKVIDASKSLEEIEKEVIEIISKIM